FYVKVAAADTTAFGTGAYALVLNFGNNPAPTVTPPNTQTLNGNPLSSGSAQPDSPPPGEDSPGRDSFDNPATNEAAHGAVSSVSGQRQTALAFSSVLFAGGAVPTQTTARASGAAVAISPPVLAGGVSVAANPSGLLSLGASLAGAGTEASDLANAEGWQEAI